jgi:hypothetical protein
MGSWSPPFLDALNRLAGHSASAAGRADRERSGFATGLRAGMAADSDKDCGAVDPSGRQIIAEGSGHCIQDDQPE